MWQKCVSLTLHSGCVKVSDAVKLFTSFSQCWYHCSTSCPLVITEIICMKAFFLGDLHSHGGETDITGKREESHAYQTLEEGRRTTAVVMLLFNVHVITMRFYFIEVFLLGAVFLSMMHLSEGKRILFLNLSCAGRLPSLGSSFPTSESFLLFLGLLAIMKCLFICFWKYLPLVVKVPLPGGLSLFLMMLLIVAVFITPTYINMW